MRNIDLAEPIRPRHWFGLRSRRAPALALAAALLAAPGAARAGDGEQSAGAGLSIGAMACTLVYGPAKLVYATLGSITSGLAWAFTGGDWSVGHPIFASSFYGDYVVTPEHLTGERSLEFVGRVDPTEHDVAAGGEGIPEPQPIDEQF